MPRIPATTVAGAKRSLSTWRATVSASCPSRRCSKSARRRRRRTSTPIPRAPSRNPTLASEALTNLVNEVRAKAKPGVAAAVAAEAKKAMARDEEAMTVLKVVGGSGPIAKIEKTLPPRREGEAEDRSRADRGRPRGPVDTLSLGALMMALFSLAIPGTACNPPRSTSYSLGVLMSASLASAIRCPSSWRRGGAATPRPTPPRCGSRGTTCVRRDR